MIGMVYSISMGSQASGDSRNKSPNTQLPGLGEIKPGELITRIVMDGIVLSAFQAYKERVRVQNNRVALKMLVVKALKDEGLLSDTYEWYRG
jgi:hypothetical protein